MAQPTFPAHPGDTAFEESYERFEEYPTNLVHGAAYNPTLLGAYYSRLTSIDQSSSLFSKRMVSFIVWDYDIDTQSFVFKKIESDADLKSSCLRDPSIDQSTNAGRVTSPRKGKIITGDNKDSKCRFFFFHGETGRTPDPLSINKKILARVFSWHQVMPEYLDFISLFGSRVNKKPRGLRFSAFKHNIMLETSALRQAAPLLARSGRCYQLCYSFYLATSFNEDLSVTNEWYAQPVAFYHHFDIEHGNSCWITIKANLEVRTRLRNFIDGKQKRHQTVRFHSAETCFMTSLEIHLDHCHWATERWIWCLNWLEDVIDERVRIHINTIRDPNPNYKLSVQDQETAQKYINKANEFARVLDLNYDIVSNMKTFYEQLEKNPSLKFQDHLALGGRPGNDPSDACKTAFFRFQTEIDWVLDDLQRHLTRARNIVSDVTGLKELIAQALQLEAQTLQVHAGEQSLELGMMQYEIAEHTVRDSIAMRIIAGLTLVYLPATFVSTVFSTDIVKYQNEDKNSSAANSTALDPKDDAPKYSYSSLAMERWGETTVALSIATILAALLWYWYDGRDVKEVGAYTKFKGELDKRRIEAKLEAKFEKYQAAASKEKKHNAQITNRDNGTSILQRLRHTKVLGNGEGGQA